MTLDSFGSRGRLAVGPETFTLWRLDPLRRLPGSTVDRLPFSLKILLENLLRHEDGRIARAEEIALLARLNPAAVPEREIAFRVARVLLQDFTGVPAVADLAAMREAVRRLGGDPAAVNPSQPVDLVIDHSVQVDHYGSAEAFARNAQLEFGRNRERYAFLRWGQGAFRRFRVVPPDTGIVHQINVEHLAQVVAVEEREGERRLVPDTLVGTDSHTTMVNALGVLGWGVGGIEAEAAMLGQPQSLLLPEVVGVRLTGRIPEGVTATDVVLQVTERLRKKGVVGKFVEFCGPGLSGFALADRATVANMAPEYGATAAFFPVDEETLRYLRLTRRPEEQVRRVEAYCKEQGLFRTDATPEPRFTGLVELDLSAVEPALAGPKRPQDRVPLRAARASCRESLAREKALLKGRGAGAAALEIDGQRLTLEDGAVVLAAITSCTNTSNPSVLTAAGLLAKRAVERGLRSRPWVKTSLAPGSKVVTRYLREAGLLEPLEALGFHLVGYGCTTCIGNSGPLPLPVASAVESAGLTVAAVLSGNRNFEGRVHPLVRLNYLASPPLVVAYALAGTMNLDLTTEPLGTDRQGLPVFLKDLWPSGDEIQQAIAAAVQPGMFEREYAEVFAGDARWQGLVAPEGDLYPWASDSTYVKRPPFVETMAREPAPPAPIRDARVLLRLGDSITTDHISPAGEVKATSPAGKWLLEHGVKKHEFNAYGARRGNHEVMLRGTFANGRLKNELVPGVEGGVTALEPGGAPVSVFDAALTWGRQGVPLVILAGKEYGTGSSRDWAAKGTALLGVRAVIAESFERIHRSNLVGMGVLPLQFRAGESRDVLRLSGFERYTVEGVEGGVRPRQALLVRARDADGRQKSFEVTCRIDTPQEAEYFAHGGILPYVVRQLAGA